MSIDPNKTIMSEIDEKTQMVSAPVSERTVMGTMVECPVCHTRSSSTETYCIDCGFLLSDQPVEVAEEAEKDTPAKLISVDGTREFPLNSGENLVGRENCEVLLLDNSVSRRHAKITIDGAKSLVEDLGSTNGTTVDRRRLSGDEKIEIKNGSELCFGTVILKYEAPEMVEETEAVAVETQSDEPAAEDSQIDAIVEQESVGPKYYLQSKIGNERFEVKTGVNTIGRRAGANDIVISDPYASGKHATIERTVDKLILTDIGSSNGTLVNGAKLEPNDPRTIQPGDEITLGQGVFGIETVTEAEIE